MPAALATSGQSLAPASARSRTPTSRPSLTPASASAPTAASNRSQALSPGSLRPGGTQSRLQPGSVENSKASQAAARADAAAREVLALASKAGDKPRQSPVSKRAVHILPRPQDAITVLEASSGGAPAAPAQRVAPGAGQNSHQLPPLSAKGKRSVPLATVAAAAVSPVDFPSTSDLAARKTRGGRHESRAPPSARESRPAAGGEASCTGVVKGSTIHPAPPKATEADSPPSSPSLVQRVAAESYTSRKRPRGKCGTVTPAKRRRAVDAQALASLSDSVADAPKRTQQAPCRPYASDGRPMGWHRVDMSFRISGATLLWACRSL